MTKPPNSPVPLNERKPKKTQKTSEKPSPSAYSFGKNGIQTILTHHPKRIQKIWFAKELLNNRRLQELLDDAKRQGLLYHIVPKAKLDQMLSEHDDSGLLHHQGVVAFVAPKPLLSLQDVLGLVNACPAQAPAIVMALDGITDPHNLGAILRVAAASGVTAVLLPKMGTCGITPAVLHTSAGMAEVVPIAQVTNLVQAMTTLKDNGVWWVGAALEPASITYDQCSLWTSAVGLVMGSEHEGLKRLVAQTCDQIVAIPMAEGVDSLNVSVASGILLFECHRQRRAAR